MRILSGILAIATGASLVIFSCGLAKTLSNLCEDEGTESFEVGLGPGGLIGCWSFIVLLAFGGVLISYHGVHVFQQNFRHGTRDA